MNGFENMCKVYGIPADIAGMIPTPEPQNTQITCKMEVVNICERAIVELEQIKSMFIKAPVDEDTYRAELMQGTMHRLKRAKAILDTVVCERS